MLEYTVGVCEGGANECRMSHDGNPGCNSAIIFVETADKIHIPADEEKLLREVNSVLHDLLDLALHLQLHLYNV